MSVSLHKHNHNQQDTLGYTSTSMRLDRVKTPLEIISLYSRVYAEDQ